MLVVIVMMTRVSRVIRFAPSWLAEHVLLGLA